MFALATLFLFAEEACSLEPLLLPFFPMRPKVFVSLSFKKPRSTGMDPAMMVAAISMPVQMLLSNASSAKREKSVG